MDLDDNVCYCFHVSKRKIVNFIRIHRPRRASQVSECGGAGTGCGWCVPFLKKLHRRMADGETDETLAVTPED
ncbi:MAG: (2Fe-2S)-binding protein, partial [Planctomycetaceae bacterium]